MTHLRQLDPMDLIRMTCDGCGHVRDWPSRFLVLICGEETTIARLERRIRCSACHNRNTNKIDVLAGQVDLQGSYFAYQEDADQGMAGSA